jgi:hypothetical protein
MFEPEAKMTSEVDDLRHQIDHLYDLLSKLWMERKSDSPQLTIDEVAQVKEALVKRRRWVDRVCDEALK